MDRSPTIGQSLQLNISVPTRFNGTVHLNARLKCEAKDTRLFNFSEENPDTVLLDQNFLLAESKPVTKDGEITGTVRTDHSRSHAPIHASRFRGKNSYGMEPDSDGRREWWRKAETEYILSVVAAKMG